ncbi:thymidylate kinase [Desulfocucumis palustris]|uniref:Thymidylate kinase n=1 Tax=Desulfocucumis palustris TaxID=1898651 RepID=A0A2L2XDZ5_9FIRM|nr:dTMP kinase [Desulfocucumis palustris]GBF34370.1 thymidylate kinase [Desulfocucumis palustris]
MIGGTGRFIVFEGIDGCGKTTQLSMLNSALGGMGHRVLCTREPGGTLLGEQIRRILLTPGTPLHPEAEALLFAASRAQNVREVILPALGSGITVLADRFTDSTLTYQGHGRGLDREFLIHLNNQAAGGLVPGLTVLLDIDPAAAMARLRGPADRLELEQVDFFSRVRGGYLSLANSRVKPYLVLDAQREPEPLHREILAAVLKLLEETP